MKNLIESFVSDMISWCVDKLLGRLLHAFCVDGNNIAVAAYICATIAAVFCMLHFGVLVLTVLVLLFLLYIKPLLTVHLFEQIFCITISYGNIKYLCICSIWKWELWYYCKTYYSSSCSMQLLAESTRMGLNLVTLKIQLYTRVFFMEHLWNFVQPQEG